jgi:hypothetical protein
MQQESQNKGIQRRRPSIEKDLANIGRRSEQIGIEI